MEMSKLVFSLEPGLFYLWVCTSNFSVYNIFFALSYAMYKLVLNYDIIYFDHLCYQCHAMKKPFDNDL